MEIKNEGMRHKELNFMNWRIDIFGRSLLLRVVRDFLKMDKKALAKFINFFLEDICQNHIKVICSYAQQ